MRLQSDEAEAGSIWKASSLTPLAPGWARAHSPGARGGGPSWGSGGLCAVPPAWGPGLPAFPHCGSRVGVPSCGRASENWKVHSRHVCSVEARGGGHPPGARVGERSMNMCSPFSAAAELRALHEGDVSGRRGGCGSGSGGQVLTTLAAGTGAVTPPPLPVQGSP